MMKTPYPALVGRYGAGAIPSCFFDIVNGFLIDAVTHRVDRLRSVLRVCDITDVKSG
jgi:hypothetical protein